MALSRNPPGTDAAVTVAFGTPVVWTLTPTLALPLTLPGGNITVPLWLRRKSTTPARTARTVQVTLANTVTGTIGSATQTLTTLPSLGLARARDVRDPESHGDGRSPWARRSGVTITQTAPNIAGAHDARLSRRRDGRQLQPRRC